MTIDYSYMEIVAKPGSSTFEGKALADLRDAVDKSSIHTFGWPLAVVIHTPELEPKPIQDGIEVRVTESGHREYWTLKRSGEFYFIAELFENLRRPESIFIDTRANRVAEAFIRIGGMYSRLGVPNDEPISLLIKHGNIKGKVLSVGNPARLMPLQRKANVNEVSTEFSVLLGKMTDPPTLKENVHRAITDLAEMFEMFRPDKAAFTDTIVDAFLQGRII